MTKPKYGFVLPAFKPVAAERNAFLSSMVTTASSAERIKENTPSLKRLYEFIAKIDERHGVRKKGS